ncbi:hypothetical protein S40285_05264 [Stachybotrys chlorohalonatus IBT 40285]|uniref:G-protein coupled receptors family 2 profile 2 domain-containing protein n=1 Tax=Stachybotrys chlorohalonatus (strain IBT 40285) TaxID=1283841 RepID=A0A084QL75_STAC4|nr:hypothetical protein S40285_05264 [Stachybotrys chlorohalonata IBT 40285]
MPRLSEGQLLALSIIERSCSVLSIIGGLFIIMTFCFSSSFHRPINRLVFYASFGNLLSNVGTMMSRSYTGSPDSAGCQLQGFLIQMFMPADACWTLAMAVNVWLTFYHKYDAARLRRMEPLYLMCCYGIPFIPAFVYVFIRNSAGNRVYGDANLWCWISREWDIWRIITFYAPVWAIILTTFFIYLRAGRTIYVKRKQLYYASRSDNDVMSAHHDNLTVKTTEVVVTTEAAADHGAIMLQSVCRDEPEVASAQRGPTASYSVTISANKNKNGSVPPGGLPENGQLQSNSMGNNEMAVARLTARRRNHELNNAAWSYTKCAILFFTAILITWIPSSANRVYSVVHTGRSLIPLEFMSAFVLPLQGFWNAVIYVTTSWSACQTLFVDLRLGRRPAVTEIVGGMRPQENSQRLSYSRHQSSGARPKPYESESTTELAGGSGESGGGRSEGRASL